MKPFPRKRTLTLIGIGLPLLILFAYTALRSGPLAPVPVVLTVVENRSVTPSLFGIGTVEARYTYFIGPTTTGRLKKLNVNVGDRVKAGQDLGEMDPVDLVDRIQAQTAALQKVTAQLQEARVRLEFARTQARRYERLLAAHSTSEEIVATRRHELDMAEAGMNTIRQEQARLQAERQSLETQMAHLKLIAPEDGLVISRKAEPGTTVAASQTVVEIVRPDSLWIHVRFDQIHAHGLAPDRPARIVLRSQSGRSTPGKVFRIEPLADPVTEETLAKVIFDVQPEPLPPIGELAEVTVALPALPQGPVLPNAAIHQVGGKQGVWKIMDGKPRFAPVTTGAFDLDGWVEVTNGLTAGDSVVLYSARVLTENSRIRIVDRIPGVQP